MIEAGLQFEEPIDSALTAFVALPSSLRPLHFSYEEKVASDADLVSDKTRFARFIADSQAGFFLLGPEVTYSIRRASGRLAVCDCFMEVEPTLVRRFLELMSRAAPIFGFACLPEEHEQRNRLTVEQGANTIESWVGRDPQKCVPGFYWLTLLSDVLAKQHGIALSTVEAAALEHIHLQGGQNLFRFYERPGDWEAATSVSELIASLSGVFDIEKVKRRVLGAKNFLELNSVLREWGG